MALMKKGAFCFSYRQPTQVVLCELGQLIRQLRREEYRPHSVMALLCGGVKVLHGFAYPANQPSIPCQFLTNLSKDGVSWTFVLQ